jgi:P4 family phage/plasmid primase-like protien
LTPAWESIDKFFDTVTRNDAQLKNLLIAACCAVLLGRSDLQKALYLFGSGANGKGTFLRLLEMLVGVENGYSTSLENLCGNRFEVANIYSKRLVICPDEDRRVGGLSVFKSITGGDSLRGEEKGRKAYSFRYNGLVAIASNDPIFVGDNSYGLSRRLIPIPFSHQIPDSERRDLSLEFMADLPAFTTYLLELDRQWVTDTLKQSKSLPSVKTLEWELATRTDSIAAFYDEKLIYDSTASIPAAQLFGEYKQFCTDGGFIAKHQNNFCPSLVALCVDKLQQPVSSFKDRTGKIVQGLRLRTIIDPICDDCDGSKVNNGIVDLPVTAVTAVTAVTTVTTVTAQNDFSIDSDPKPPTVDRPIPETTKVNADVEYLIVDGEVEWLEVFFRKHSIAKDWKNQATLWGCQTSALQMPPNRKGNKWLLIIKGLTRSRLEMLLQANLDRSPQLATR